MKDRAFLQEARTADAFEVKACPLATLRWT